MMNRQPAANSATTRAAARSGAMLLLTASALALAASPASAQEVIFSSSGQASVAIGQRIAQMQGVTQVRLPNGATLSFVEAAEYRLHADGSVELFSGSVTVAGTAAGEVIVRMPDGAQGSVAGAGSAASFTVDGEGLSSGHVLTGSVQITRGRNQRRFDAGEMWASAGRAGLRQRVASGPQVVPGPQPAAVVEEPVLADLSEGGPLAAAENGLPVSLGDALAAAGAASDIVGAARRVEAASANPSLDTFPSGDLALLVAAAADLANANGGAPFPEAQADIIRAYLGWLAGGGAGAQFLSAYAGFLGQYLDLIRAGGLPSGFTATRPVDLEAFLAWRGRTGALASLAARDRVLAEAYLAFLAQGGNRDAFAATYTDLVRAYFAFVRGGGDPLVFAGASQQVLADYIAFLAASGLEAQLAAADRALLQAYLANGGLAFANQYRAVLAAYADFLAAGNLPSQSELLSPAQLRQYLETLASAGLFEQVLGANAGFYQALLAHLRAGGAADAFAGLNANIFAGYAEALNGYYAFLLAGNLPSAFAGDPAQLAAWLRALAEAGALERFLGDKAGFFAAYLAHLDAGGAADAFAGLNANIFAGYGSALAAFYDYLLSGGLPSAYGALSQEQIAAFVAALEAQGATSAFLGELADFYTAYAAYLATGADPDIFTGLPVLNLPAFADALGAYAAFLAGGGLPSEYDAVGLATLANYLAAIANAGQLEDLLGGNAALLSAYFAHLAGGGAPDGFAGLPVYAGYVGALQAYFDFLAGGGLPSAYTQLTPEQIADYLAALGAAGGLAAQLGDLAEFYTGYFAFIAAGGVPDRFAGLPLYASYASALQDYFAFLAGGGLPGDYTALTPEQIEAYLAALNLAGGFTLQLGEAAAAFFTDYFAFISGGGDPADFTGLPAYAQYLADLQAFYAYLAGGGLPSGYALLTQAQIQAYLALLDRLGLLATSFQGAVLNFWTNYLAFLAGGGVPDDFTGLPGGAGGQIASGHTWISDPNGIGVGATTTVEVAANGVIGQINYASSAVRDFTSDSNYTAEESGRIGTDVAWTRFQRGATSIASNWNSHVLTGTLPTNLPTSGKVDYILVGGTSPTNHQGAAGSVGSFEGSLAVSYGAPPRVGFEMDVYMDNRGWRAATMGGSANPQLGGFQLNPTTGRFEGGMATTGILGAACTVSCSSYVHGGLFGDAGATAGLTYTVSDTNAQITGIAIFGTSGTELPMIGTRPDLPGGGGMLTGYTGGFDPLNPRIFFRTTLTLSGGATTAGSEAGFEALAYTLDANGGLQSYTRNGGTTRSRGTTSQTDVFGNADALIGRWTNGTNTGGNPFTLNANQGLHYVLTRPVPVGFALPASGVIHYQLLAATQPTIVDGSVAPGSFTGDMAIVLGAQNRIAMEATITVSGLSLQYGTLGGVANPELSQTNLQVNPNLTFQFFVPGVGGNANCAADTCYLWGNGAFAGDADTLGLSYGAYHAGGNAKTVIGAAIFGNGTVSTPPPAGAMAAAAAEPMMLAASEWERWEVPEEALSTSTATAPGLDAAAARGISFSPEQLALLAAVQGGGE